jgi:hypothetical protein
MSWARGRRTHSSIGILFPLALSQVIEACTTETWWPAQPFRA